MADLRREFWIRETGTGQQVAKLHDRYDDDDDDDDDDDLRIVDSFTGFVTVSTNCTMKSAKLGKTCKKEPCKMFWLPSIFKGEDE